MHFIYLHVHIAIHDRIHLRPYTDTCLHTLTHLYLYQFKYIHAHMPIPVYIDVQIAKGILRLGPYTLKCLLPAKPIYSLNMFTYSSSHLLIYVYIDPRLYET
jgi:hypothetical protein